MKSGKLITGIAVGVVVALILIPKTRKMLSKAASGITDSIRDMLDHASEMAGKGKNEVNKIAGAVKTTKEAWQ